MHMHHAYAYNGVAACCYLNGSSLKFCSDISLHALQVTKISLSSSQQLYTDPITALHIVARLLQSFNTARSFSTH